MNPKKLMAYIGCLMAVASPALASKVATEQPVDMRDVAMMLRQVVTGEEGLVLVGRAFGRLEAEMRAKTKSPGPFKLEVKRIRKLDQPGCGRVRLTYLIPKAPTQEGGASDVRLDTELNICEDGLPPGVTKADR